MGKLTNTISEIKGSDTYKAMSEKIGMNQKTLFSLGHGSYALSLETFEKIKKEYNPKKELLEDLFKAHVEHKFGEDFLNRACKRFNVDEKKALQVIYELETGKEL